jgi:RNA polymerase sigma-70 factor, ECF subfamily
VTDVETFESLRPRLFGIAYRMTGSVADADDLCQEAWLRWSRGDRSDIESMEAYLVRTVSNGAIDRLTSAQRRRETYVGPYLPEPLVSGVDDEPAESAELADSLTFAFLVMLDALTPAERVVLLLHDVFGYSFDDVGTHLGRSAAACRQMATRARRKVDEHLPDVRRPDGSSERELVERLVATIFAGDLDGLTQLLTADVVHLSDGGPSRRAARRPVVGCERVARLLVNLGSRIDPTADLALVRVNGTLGGLLTLSGRPDLVLVVEFAPDGRARRVFTQLNPDKLSHLV